MREPVNPKFDVEVHLDGDDGTRIAGEIVEDRLRQALIRLEQEGTVRRWKVTRDYTAKGE